MCYNFPLYPSRSSIQADGSHRFIHISDTEISQIDGNQQWVENIRDYAANEHIAFVMHTGDICYEAGLKSHIKLLNTSMMEDTQVFYAIGNHDLVKGAYGEELFEQLYGPTFYSFDVGNVHYQVTPMLHGDTPPDYTKEDVYRWMKNDLAHVGKGKSIMVFNHSLPEDTVSFKYGQSNKEQIDLPAMGLKVWLYGHWHVNHIHKHQKTGVYTICSSTPACGGIDHAPSAFRVITVNSKHGLTSAFRYSYMAPYVQVTSLSDNHAPVLPSGNTPLSVNAYSTIAPTKSVEYWCEYAGKRISVPRPLQQQTDFNWYTEMDIPDKWKGRELTVVVKALFSNGESKVSRRPFAHRQTTTDHAASPQLRWVQNMGASVYMSAPVVYQGNVFAASVDDNESGKASITCIDALAGSIRWRYPVRGSIRGNIAAANGRIFAQDVHGQLYAIHTNTGKLAWTKDLGIGTLPPLNDGLTANDSVVYAGTGLSLCASNTTTGEVLWRNKAWNRGEGCVASLFLEENILIGHAHWKGLYANDATTGELLWENKDEELRYRSASVAIFGGNLYLLSSHSLFILNAKTGSIIVRKKLGYSVDVNSTPLVTDTEIIFGTASKGIVALDRQTLEEKWNYQTKPALIYTVPYSTPPSATVETSPVRMGNTVLTGGSDGTLYALHRQSGHLIWKFHVGVPIFASVAVSGQNFYLADFAGNVYGFTWP